MAIAQTLVTLDTFDFQSPGNVFISHVWASRSTFEQERHGDTGAGALATPALRGRHALRRYHRSTRDVFQIPLTSRRPVLT